MAHIGPHDQRPQYAIDGARNLKEALGFMKDWVTAVIQLQTAILGAIGGALVLKDTPDMKLSTPEALDLLVTSIAFVFSIGSGMMLLNVLPGAVQRVPANDAARRSDIYSIYTVGTPIHGWSMRFRWGFILAMAGIAVFVGLRVWPYLVP